MKSCPYCNTSMNEDDRFCPECGREYPQRKTCTNCGAPINDEDLFCQNCGASVNKTESISHMSDKSTEEVKKCPQCGKPISDGDLFCQECGAKIDNTTSIVGNYTKNDNTPEPKISDVEVQTKEQQIFPTQNESTIHEGPKEPTPNSENTNLPQKEETTAIPQQQTSTYSYQNKPTQTSKNSGVGILITIIVVLLLAIGGIGGYFYYQNIYLPEKIDREAPRYYTFADSVVLRSSKSSGADFNKLGSLPFGTELIVYERDTEWTKVKVNSQNSELFGTEGYIASPYTLDKHDFFILNSIFGNQESRETISTAKCRIALLNYFKEYGYTGKIDEQVKIDAGIETLSVSDNLWQVFCKPKDVKPNSVLYKRLYDRSSQFTDFAVIITNVIDSTNRRILYFYFDEDETPHLFSDEYANAPYIKDAIMVSDYYTGEKISACLLS